MAHLIYERPPERLGRVFSWHGPKYNSLQAHHRSLGGHNAGVKLDRSKSVDCLAPLGIDFDELRLLRVQRRPTGFRSTTLGLTDQPKVELFLGSLPPDQLSKRSHRPTSLQPTPLLRTDTVSVKDYNIRDICLFRTYKLMSHATWDCYLFRQK